MFLSEIAVSLLVRLWVEIILSVSYCKSRTVSLLVRLWVEIYKEENHGKKKEGQPPCEAVSWNLLSNLIRLILMVSLLVRLWVEMMDWEQDGDMIVSASLWGCELKFHPWLIRTGFIRVSLLVRLWVEITSPDRLYRAYVSASLWGCELKWSHIHLLSNYTPSASLWGCELKWVTAWARQRLKRQPPCEAVSWNNSAKFLASVRICQPPCEAVSWNIELFALCLFWPVSLLVRLWVEMQAFRRVHLSLSRQPPCEAVSWNVQKQLSAASGDLSASLWGCELKCFHLT